MRMNNVIREEFSFFQSNSLDIPNELMRIGMIGINHKSADVGLREKFAKACQRRFGPGCSTHFDMSYVLLSTCNRTEVYFSSEDLPTTHTYLLGILRTDISIEFEHKVYSYFGGDCFFHLARVTAGRDSAIMGETEIQGQVKQAYESAASYHLLSRELHFLFQKSLKIGKDVRAFTTSSRTVFALEDAILSAAVSTLGDLQDKHILFVGVSEINYKVFLGFKNKGLKNITFCNRSYNRADAFCKKERIKCLPWQQLDQWPFYDCSIFGTRSPEYLISQKMVHSASRSPKLLIDLCIPRNIDPSLSKYFTLLNIDQLQQRLQTSQYGRLDMHDLVVAVTKQVAIFQDKESYRHASLLSEVS